MRRLIISILLTVLILVWLADYYLVGEPAEFDWKVFVIVSSIGFLTMYKLVQYLAKFKIVENNSRIDIVFIACVVAFMYFPASKINHDEISVQENRTLAKYVPLIEKGKINYNYGRDFEAWFNDRFNQRKFFIDVHSALSRFIDKKLKNEKAMAGKDNWLFTKRWNSVEMLQNKELFSDEDLQEIKENLEGIKKWAAKRGIKFYVFLIPDKERIYPEYYPKEFKKVREESKIGQLYDFIRTQTSVPVVYPYEALMAAKPNHILYYKTGTHWNHRGAYVAYKEMMKMLKKDFPSLYVMKESDFNIQPKVEADVDIASALGIDAYSVFPKEDLTYDVFEVKNPKTVSGHEWVNKKKKIETYDYVNREGGRKPRAVFYGDSMFLRMNWYTAESFAKMQHIYTGYGRDFDVVYMAEDIKKQKPDIFVIETGERFLERLQKLEVPED